MRILELQCISVQLNSAEGWTEGWGLESAPDVYCIVSVAGGPPQDKQHHKSKTIDNSKSPVWNETATFDLACPELAVVTLEFWDDDDLSGDDYLGHVSLPLSEVITGEQLVIPLLGNALTLWSLGGQPTVNEANRFCNLSPRLAPVVGGSRIALALVGRGAPRRRRKSRPRTPVEAHRQWQR